MAGISAIVLTLAERDDAPLLPEGAVMEKSTCIVSIVHVTIGVGVKPGHAVVANEIHTRRGQIGGDVGLLCLNARRQHQQRRIDERFEVGIGWIRLHDHLARAVQRMNRPRRQHEEGGRSVTSVYRSSHTFVSRRSRNVTGRTVRGTRITSTGETTSFKQPQREP